VYGFDTATMALLLGVCATVNIFMAPLVGRLTDRIGYRRVMIYDTVILFFVCLLYGFAGELFAPALVVAVLCANFLLDSVISTSALATNLYAKIISDNQSELTSTLSTGISINHLISVLAAPLGGWVWSRYGVGALFAGAAVMAVFNSLFAMSIPKTDAGAQGNSSK
jgi:MFS family permease